MGIKERYIKMGIKLRPEDYPDVINTYNSEGKTAAYRCIREKYGIKNPSCVFKRLRESDRWTYNPDKDIFETDGKGDEGLFLNLDELCGSAHPGKNKKETDGPTDQRNATMEAMIHSLVADRLLELSRYVILDPVSRHIIIDRTAMQTDGYAVSIH